MSLPQVIYACERCSSRWGDDFAPRKYRLPSREMVPVKSTMGWCKICANLVAIEDTDDAGHLLTELEIILSELKRGDSSLRWFRRKKPSDSLDFRIAEVRDAILRLGFRKSAPRCLHCGSTEIRKAEFPSQHPGCGGTVSYERNGPEVRVAYDCSNPLLYDTEGSFLGRLKPTVGDLPEGQHNRRWNAGPSDYPPSTWLRSIMTLEEFEQEFPNYMNIPYLAEFIRLRQEGDELWRFSSPPEQWATLAGRGGTVLVRDGRSVAHVVTVLS
jgi:hypothetical protein